MGAYPDNRPDTCSLCGKAFKAEGSESWLTPDILACPSCSVKLQLKGMPELYIVHRPEDDGGYTSVRHRYPFELEDGEGEIPDEIEITIFGPKIR